MQLFLPFILILTIFYPNPINAVYNERPCASRGGQCMAQQHCSGSTVSGLCPRQPRNIKCCLASSTGANTCGCGYDYATRPTDGPAVGARRLAEYFKGRFGGRTEIYNNRNIRGGHGLSLHAEGRAVDIYLSGVTGRQAFNHAVSIACENGIQEVIFNRRIWTQSRGEHAYHGSNPHTDHVHIGLNRCGAQNFNL